MARVWKMIASTQGLGGSAPLKQYFLVAIDDRDEAIESLKVRNRLFDAVITVAGEASPDFAEWLHVQAGDIVCVLAVS
jgi:hypothetical protein